MFAAILWKSFAAGKTTQSANQEKDRADAYEKDLDRIGRAADARADAERAARDGLLDDKWTRDD